MTRFAAFNPYLSGVNQTHLAYALRGISWARTRQKMTRYSSAVLVGMAALTFFSAWLFPAVFAVLAAAGLLLFLAVDFACVLFAVMWLRAERTDGRLEIIRTSAMNPETYVAQQLTLTRIRAWRFLMVMMGLRVGVAVGVVGSVLLTLSGYFSPSDAGAAFFGALIFGPMWLWEPFWRFGMMTAMGVEIAAKRPGDGVWVAVLWQIALRSLIALVIAAAVTAVGMVGGVPMLFSNNPWVAAFGLAPFVLIPVLIRWFMRAAAAQSIKRASATIFEEPEE